MNVTQEVIREGEQQKRDVRDMKFIVICSFKQVDRDDDNDGDGDYGVNTACTGAQSRDHGMKILADVNSLFTTTIICLPITRITGSQVCLPQTNTCRQFSLSYSVIN